MSHDMSHGLGTSRPSCRPPPKVGPSVACYDPFRCSPPLYAAHSFVAVCPSQMIYFVFVASVLAVQNGAVLDMTGEAAKINFDGALTLIHNATEDKLTCSGTLEASDVRIAGTSTTVADLIGEVATLRQEVAGIVSASGNTVVSSGYPGVWILQSGDNGATHVDVFCNMSFSSRYSYPTYSGQWKTDDVGLSRYCWGLYSSYILYDQQTWDGKPQVNCFQGEPPHLLGIYVKAPEEQNAEPSSWMAQAAQLNSTACAV